MHRLMAMQLFDSVLVLDPEPSDHFKYRMNKAIYLELISLWKSNFAFDKIVV